MSQVQYFLFETTASDTLKLVLMTKVVHTQRYYCSQGAVIAPQLPCSYILSALLQ